MHYLANVQDPSTVAHQCIIKSTKKMSYKILGWELEIWICACQENAFNSNLLDATRYKVEWRDNRKWKIISLTSNTSIITIMNLMLS